MSKKGKKLKNLEKQKQKVIADKTFGLKNKNKSKKVQKQLDAVKAQMKDSGLSKQDKKRLEEKEQRKQAKLAAKEREKELKELFGDAVQAKKPQLQAQENEEEEKEKKDMNREPTEEELMSALSALAEVEKELAEEGDLSLEEYIEKERAKIISGTPVTEESFAVWKKFKRDLIDRERAQREQDQLESFKKSGHGATGRMLFQIKQDMFVDDEAAEVKTKRDQVQVDEDLFLDDDDDDEEEEDDLEEEYNPATWKGDTPKSALTTLCGKRKVDMPTFTNISQGGGEGFAITCTLPHLDKSFTCAKIYPSKKIAEHNAALLALRYLEKNES